MVQINKNGTIETNEKEKMESTEDTRIVVDRQTRKKAKRQAVDKDIPLKQHIADLVNGAESKSDNKTDSTD